MSSRIAALLALLFLLGSESAFADPPTVASTQPSTQPAPSEKALGKLPHLEFDAVKKQVRVECEALGVETPVEFFCCVKGTNDYEAILRAAVKPSDLHFALLAIGLKPGSPITYSEESNKWTPAHGDPIHISVQFEQNGKTVTVPAYRLLRDVKTKKEAAPFDWVFAGSRMIQGKYAGDTTGYLASVVNFDLTVIDVPQMASNSNEQLEWERNPDVAPKAGAKVIMILEHGKNPRKDAERAATAPSTAPVSVPD